MVTVMIVALPYPTPCDLLSLLCLCELNVRSPVTWLALAYFMDEEAKADITLGK